MIHLLSNRFHLAMLIGWVIIFVILWQADWYRSLDGYQITCKQSVNCPLGTYCKSYSSTPKKQCRPLADALFRD